MPTVLITGANRGLGVEFVRQYANDGWRILACCRNPDEAADLKAIDFDGDIVAMDVNDTASVQSAAQTLAREKIDVLLNNAGVIGKRGDDLGSMDYDMWQDCFNTNVFGPMRVVESFIDHVRAGNMKKIATVSSRMGSMSLNAAANSISYRSSKAAVNMTMNCVANGLDSEGFTVVLFHPGWVQTDMGGAAADIDAVTSVTGMRTVIGKVTQNDNGSFFNYDGAVLPW